MTYTLISLFYHLNYLATGVRGGLEPPTTPLTVE